MSTQITKAILPLAGLGTRFLPLTKAVYKEILPLVDKPILHYLVKEALDSGIKEIIFVLSPGKKKIVDYFKPSLQLRRTLKKRGKLDLLKEVESIPDFDYKIVYQRFPKGQGDAILKAEKFIGNEPCAVLFGDDLIDGDTPALKQMINIFTNYKHSVICLSRVSREKLSSYGIVNPEKIAHRLYKIKGIVEKPKIDEAPSDLAAVGKYIITPDVFDFLRNLPPVKGGGEVGITDAFEAMLKKGKLIYGYEVKGEWLECGNKLEYLKTFIKLAKRDPRFVKELRDV